MKLKNYRIVSSALSLLIVAILIIGMTFQAFAETTFTYGDYKFAVGEEEGTCLVYSYMGEDSAPNLPETVYNRKVIGISDDCFNASKIESVTIPDSYRIIGDASFYDCKNLVEIHLPKNLESIGALAFAHCSSLTTVDIKDCNLLEEIPYSAFSNDALLTDIELPTCIKTIGDYAFSGCGFDSLVFNPNIEVIGECAYADNKSLANIELSDSVSSIGAGAFSGNTALSEVFIPDTVLEIGKDGFDKSTHITCYSGSYAEKYCCDNKYNYTAIDKLYGDVNLNGKVEILDVTQIQKYKIGEDTIPSYRAKELADVNKDGQITVRDATLIQMYLAKIIENFD